MLRSTSTQRQPLVIMMLFMMLWQCLFVAVEAGAAVSPGADIHHPITDSATSHRNHPCPATPCPATPCPATPCPATPRLSHHSFDHHAVDLNHHAAALGHHAFDLDHAADAADRHSGGACDHCCACQGHGTHISIHVKGFSFELMAPSFQAVITLQDFPALYPPSIYRPPIR